MSRPSSDFPELLSSSEKSSTAAYSGECEVTDDLNCNGVKEWKVLGNDVNDVGG